MTVVTHASQHRDVAPEYTFLTAQQVTARYGWGQTKGYRMLRSEGFPRPIGGDRYRLDGLMDWESHQQAAFAPLALGPALPPRKRRSAASRQ